MSTGTVNLVNSCTCIFDNNLHTINLPSLTGAFYQINLINSTPMFTNGLTNGLVFAISLDSTYAYVAGEFSSFLKGDKRNALARFNLTTGLLDPLWNPNVDAQVTAVTIDSVNNLCYIGGSFNQVGTTTVSGLARINSATGSTGVVDSNWLPIISGDEGAVASLILDNINNMLYVGGSFTSVNGFSYSNLARIDSSPTSVGAVDSFWNPACDQLFVTSIVLDSTNHLLYAGGNFANVNVFTSPVSRNGVARFDCTGSFNGGSVGLVDSVWDPNCNGGINKILLNNNYLYAGGVFSGVNNNTSSRFGLARFDTITGTVDSWNPMQVSDLFSPNVVDLAIDSNYIYTISNIGLGSMERFDLMTGSQDTSWSFIITSGSIYVISIDTNNNKLYTGTPKGIFTNLKINTYNANQYIGNNSSITYNLLNDSSEYKLIGSGNKWIISTV